MACVSLFDTSHQVGGTSEHFGAKVEVLNEVRSIRDNDACQLGKSWS